MILNIEGKASTIQKDTNPDSYIPVIFFLS